MATTTNYGWVTPDDTALVKDGAAAIRTLGTSADTTVYNNDLAAIKKTIVDAKGDLIAATAADTVARLAVGTNGQVLTADSTAATGLAFATPASGGMTLISTTSLTGATVTLSSIPATFNHLQLIITNYKPATDAARGRMRFNGDAGASRYKYVSITDASSFADSFINNAISPNDNSIANGLSIIDIFDYKNATTYKFSQMRSIGVDATTTANYTFDFGFGLYNQITAISSIDLFPNTGNFTSGTVLLYGVK